ncbi:hypothetical protein C8A01DRAFT_41490 [Parachaetomium inaequale]|uniref:Uncharacterized protein n=1 Tax=Parachaetomium inaequale TaxID=2588326 RepID=A0AAN6SM12_9PEZI|nr:hypothetical protein C8A01DRAFT_41490 [Parachaetomium inaequale]
MGHSKRSDTPSKPKHRPDAVARGAIVWLPAKRFIKPKLLPHIPAETFDHPVLIYRVPEPGKAHVFLVSTQSRSLNSQGGVPTPWAGMD